MKGEATIRLWRNPEYRKKMITANRRSHIGQVPWNKGKKGLQVAWNKGIKTDVPQFKGERHHLWRGDKVGYRALHAWVERQLGKPDKCAHCKNSGLKSYQINWASKSGLYKRDIKDWLRLCIPCHRKYDKK